MKQELWGITREEIQISFIHEVGRQNDGRVFLFAFSLCHGPKPATIEFFSCKYYKILARIAMSRAALVRPVWRLGFARSCHDGQCFHRPMATATPARIAVIRSTSQRGGWAGDSFHQGISYRLLQSQSQCGSNMRLHLVPKPHFEKKLSRKSWTQGLRCCGKKSYAIMSFCDELPYDTSYWNPWRCSFRHAIGSSTSC